ncbi:MAG TPA: nuclear transport factor 2 family protein [Gemmatimonadaceae bacterium]|nr:nuclear transport factor 2 family protein [Gemmatimonadaceae bacterium]
MLRHAVLAITVLSLTTGSAIAQSSSDSAAVRRAVLDYVEGFYEGDTLKLQRSIRPEVYKYGFWIPRGSTTYDGEQMPWPKFLEYANQVRANNRVAPATAPKDIVVYEAQDQTASAKLTASWGTDYLLLGKFGGKWMITHVLWQTTRK